MLPLTIRPAQPSDRDAVAAFCARIWDGQDYLPTVWEEWLHDQQAIFLTALLDGVPVAVARAAFPAPDEAWMEGMRVDPDHQGAGIATELFAALIEASRARGARVARLMTVADNYPVHRMCARLGFGLLLRLRRRSRPLEIGPIPPALRQLGPDELPLAQEILARPARTARFLEVTGGRYSLAGGIWSTWSAERLRRHLERGEVWTWKGEKGCRALAVVCPHRRRPGVFEAGLVEGPGPDATALLAALVRRDVLPPGEADHPPAVRMYLPVELPHLHRAAARAGYRPAWRGQMFIFERTF